MHFVAEAGHPLEPPTPKKPFVQLGREWTKHSNLGHRVLVKCSSKKVGQGAISVNNSSLRLISKNQRFPRCIQRYNCLIPVLHVGIDGVRMFYKLSLWVKTAMKMEAAFERTVCLAKHRQILCLF